MNKVPNTVTRRALLALLASAPFVPGCSQKEKAPISKAAPYVKPREIWTANHFFEFLQALPPDSMLRLHKSQGLLSQDATTTHLAGPEADARAIQKQLLRLSSSAFTRPFRDASKLNYHDAVVWIAKKVSIAPTLIDNSPTFHLEQLINKQLFVQLWDKLTPDQRSDLLNKIDSNGKVADSAAIVAMSGAAALAALSTTVAFTGFAFYTTMSLTIAATASVLGFTLPFAAYTGASTIVAALTGPIGWGVIGVASLGGLALAGRANVQKTTVLLTQLHALKVEALQAAGIPERDIFKS